MPTFHFLLYLLALVAAILFRLSYLGWFGPYLLAVVCFVPLLLLVMSIPCMARFQCRLLVPPQVTRGSGATLVLHFSHPPLSALGSVKLWIEMENRFTGEVIKGKYSASCLSAEDAELPLPTALCGELVCKITRMECRDVLGMLAIRRSCPPPVTCVVLPMPKAPDKKPNIEAAMQTAAVWKPKYGGGFSEEHDMRPYQQGDTISSIHWKLSSKTDELIVREPLVQVNNQVFLILSHTGADDRGLEVLYWLSLELCRMEIPHVLVGPIACPVANEAEAAEAMAQLLSLPMGAPCSVDLSLARCVFYIFSGEVQLQ